MKYYVYVSDLKVEMLSGQLKENYDSVKESVNLGFGIKGTSGSCTEEKQRIISRYQKVERIIRQLRKGKLIGKLGEDKEYISGTYEMGWTGNVQGPTYWGGEIQRGDVLYVIGLIGSGEHVIGSGYHGKFHSSSRTGFFYSFIDQLIHSGKIVIEDPKYDETKDEIPHHMMVYQGNYNGERYDYEFIAKVLHYEICTGFLPFKNYLYKTKETHFILATPLYVSLAQLRKDDVVLVNGRKRLKMTKKQIARCWPKIRNYSYPNKLRDFLDNIEHAFINADMYEEAQEYSSVVHKIYNECSIQINQHKKSDSYIPQSIMNVLNDYIYFT